MDKTTNQKNNTRGHRSICTISHQPSCFHIKIWAWCVFGSNEINMHCIIPLLFKEDEPNENTLVKQIKPYIERKKMCQS